ncbi:MAG: hypothetical protein QOD66_83 [Solirubrobacteraceae bacterium]|nr:hypothetical protein [Solirubrobacteraceae bacterium]
MTFRGWIAGFIVAAAAAAGLVLPVNALAGPDPVSQPITDGCQRSPAGLLSYTSPEWVFVGGKSSPADATRIVEGGATLVHTADEDLPQGHFSYDLDWDVVPDPLYGDLLAGNPGANNGQGNGNYAHDADQGKLHVEWESGIVPTFVWPNEGDRVKLWGQWIWDCGHWGQGFVTDPSNPQASLIGTGDYVLPGQLEGAPPGALRGEQTELHPMQAIVVNRSNPYRPTAPENETDFYVSNDGTHALGEERCAKQLTPLPALASYGPDFSACVNSGLNELQDIRRSYDFFVPAPPKPSPNAQLRYRETPMVTGSGATEQVTPVSNGLMVHVDFAQVPAGNTAARAFGASYFVGWEGHTFHGPTHLQFTLKSVKVNHSLDPNPDRPTQTGPPPGEYNLYLNLNGYWNFIGGRGLTNTSDDSWAPALGAVSDGQVVPVNRTVDFFVQSGKPVRIDVSGRECDLPRMDPCLVNGEVSDGNDHPGQAIVSFHSADESLGDHTLVSPVNDNYEIAYRIDKLSGVGHGPTPACSSGVPSSSTGGTLGGGGTVLCTAGANTGCVDARAARSRFTLSALRASRQRIRLAGTASDVGCSGRAGTVKLTSVALARLDRGKCRFLQSNGGFGRRVSCSRRVFLRAHGTKSWSFSRRRSFPRARYRAWVRSVDAAGNVELAGRDNTTSFRVR